MLRAKIERLLVAAQPPQKRLTYAFVAATVVAIAILHDAIQGRPVFPVDDAYITLHNALVLDSGGDLNYRVPALAGATSCAHVLIVALFAKILSPLWALEIVAWLAVLGYAIGLSYLAFTVGGSVAVALGTTVLGLTVGLMPHQLLNGLETGLALGAMTWAIALAYRDDCDRRSAYALPALCGFLPFARPELAALSALLLATRWYRARSSARVSVIVARDLAIATLAASPFLLVYLLTTGSIWPNTIAAKKYFFAEGCRPGLAKLRDVLSSLGDLAKTLGIFSLALFAQARSRVGRACLVFAAIFLFAYYKEFPGALAHYEQRYAYVLVPPLLLAAAQAAASKVAAWRRLGEFLLVAGLFETAEHFHERWAFHLATRGFTQVELGSVADFVQENSSPDDVILVHDAGYISFATTRHLVDLVGLKTPSNTAYHRDITWATCGGRRGDAIAAIASAYHPKFLVVLDGWDDVFGVSRSLREHGWRTQALRPLGSRYQVFLLSSPGG